MLVISRLVPGGNDRIPVSLTLGIISTGCEHGLITDASRSLSYGGRGADTMLGLLDSITTSVNRV